MSCSCERMEDSDYDTSKYTSGCHARSEFLIICRKGNVIAVLINPSGGNLLHLLYYFTTEPLKLLTVFSFIYTFLDYNSFGSPVLSLWITMKHNQHWCSSSLFQFSLFNNNLNNPNTLLNIFFVQEALLPNLCSAQIRFGYCQMQLNFLSFSLRLCQTSPSKCVVCCNKICICQVQRRKKKSMAKCVGTPGQL